jgi:hypothetical protein
MFFVLLDKTTACEGAPMAEFNVAELFEQTRCAVRECDLRLPSRLSFVALHTHIVFKHNVFLSVGVFP